jgi:hypothetical protein
MTSVHVSIDRNSCCLKIIRPAMGIQVSACSISQAMPRTTGGASSEFMVGAEEV